MLFPKIHALGIEKTIKKLAFPNHPHSKCLIQSRIFDVCVLRIIKIEKPIEESYVVWNEHFYE